MRSHAYCRCEVDVRKPTPVRKRVRSTGAGSESVPNCAEGTQTRQRATVCLSSWAWLMESAVR